MYRMAAKMYAVLCGYAVPGLVFYYIPNSASIKSKADVRGHNSTSKSRDGTFNSGQMEVGGVRRW
jgi:hypothetical protein